MLVRDEQDPPRFYLGRKGRRELIAIGDHGLALRQFSREAQRLRALRRARPAAGNVIQFRQLAAELRPAATFAEEDGHAA